MKLNFKGTLGLLMGVVFFYTSCKKIDSTLAPATPTQTKTLGADAASSQIALNLVQSLSGAYGGVSIKNGINSPTGLTGNASSIQLNSLNSSSICGFFIDSLIDFKTNIGDSIKSQTQGTIAFYFKCGGPHHTGFLNDDSLFTSGHAPGYHFTFDITQHYDVKALNSDNNHIFVDGKIKTFIDITPNNPSVHITSLHNKFVLDGLVVNVNTFDITGGTATFTSIGDTGFGSWSFTGTVEFIGHHKALVTIYSKTYKIDLLTGQIIP